MFTLLGGQRSTHRLDAGDVLLLVVDDLPHHPLNSKRPASRLLDRGPKCRFAPFLSFVQQELGVTSGSQEAMDDLWYRRQASGFDLGCLLLAIRRLNLAAG